MPALKELIPVSVINEGLRLATEEMLARFETYSGPLECVLDIGANRGALGIAAALRGARHVVAVEPHPLWYREIELNRNLVGVAHVVHPVNAAVSRESGGRVTLRGLGNDTGQASIVYSNAVTDLGTVPALSFVDLVGRLGHVDYCKIDVEGGEYLFLDPEVPGTEQALRRIAFLDLELHGTVWPGFVGGRAQPRDQQLRVQSLLQSLGLECTWSDTEADTMTLARGFIR